MERFSLRNVDQRLIGAVGLVIGLVAMAAAFSVSTFDLFSPRYELTGSFTDVAGLDPGATVRQAGVDVGEVTAIEPDFTQGRVSVRFVVDNGVRLGPETVVEIAPGTLFGNEYLRLRGPVAEPYLTDGHVFAPDQTRTLVQIVQAVDEATTTIDRLDVPAMTEVLDTLSEVGADSIDHLDGLLDNAGALADVIEGREDELDGLLAQGTHLAELLDRKDAELGRLSTAAQALLAEVEARRDVLSAFLGEGNAAIVDLTRVIADNRAQLDRIVADTGIVVTEAQGFTEDLNTMLAYIGPSFEGIGRGFSDQGDWLNIMVFGVGPFTSGPVADEVDEP